MSVTKPRFWIVKYKHFAFVTTKPAKAHFNLAIFKYTKATSLFLYKHR